MCHFEDFFDWCSKLALLMFQEIELDVFGVTGLGMVTIHSNLFSLTGPFVYLSPIRMVLF